MALAGDYPVRLICRATGWPRSSLYLGAAPDAGEAELRHALTRLAGAWPTYGYRRLTALLRREGRSGNAKRVRRGVGAPGVAGKAGRGRGGATRNRPPLPRLPEPGGRPGGGPAREGWGGDRTYGPP